MQFSMKNLDQLSLNEMEELLSSSRKVTWQTEDDEAKYDWIGAVLKAQRYAKLGKREKGVVRRFLQKVTTTSRAQMTRLIGQWLENRRIVRKTAPRPAFAVRYTREDIVLLAAADAAHEDLAGPAMRHILHREFKVSALRIVQSKRGMRVQVRCREAEEGGSQDRRITGAFV